MRLVDKTPEQATLFQILAQITDPEIPVLTIDEMGILRQAELVEDTVVVTITPTYSGCPAIDQITQDISHELSKHGYHKCQVKLVLSPAWTTDWMSETSKQKLKNYGISPPCHTSLESNAHDVALPISFKVVCPQCDSLNTKQISEFGSTACKALWKCIDCLEPFDYFKPL